MEYRRKIKSLLLLDKLLSVFEVHWAWCRLAMDDSERLSVRLTAHGKNERCVGAGGRARGTIE